VTVTCGGVSPSPTPAAGAAATAGGAAAAGSTTSGTGGAAGTGAAAGTAGATGQTIRPPNTGDAGLKDGGSQALGAVLLATALVVLSVAGGLALRRV